MLRAPAPLVALCRVQFEAWDRPPGCAPRVSLGPTRRIGSSFRGQSIGGSRLGAPSRGEDSVQLRSPGRRLKGSYCVKLGPPTFPSCGPLPGEARGYANETGDRGLVLRRMGPLE